ncbi:MAG TPA: NAD(P)H-dependent oxidoreductase [Candidatus Onthousia faecigallinarum]|nr:NAD(P)H-dependent oxidoreductase [Candidatus Onthousia faecigallinarum]
MKIALIYFSYSGHTRRIVSMLKEKLKEKVDVFEIKAKEPYSSDYDTVVELGQEEVNQGLLRAIKDLDIPLERYEHIILATPVWWYTIPPVVHTFLTKYDLKEKEVMPLITYGGWLGHTIEDMKEYCPKATDGFLLKFDGDNLVTDQETIDKIEKEIEEWK